MDSVSIPARDSGELEADRVAGRKNPHLFQSLLGIQGNWKDYTPAVATSQLVSIPARDSGELEAHCPKYLGLRAWFQSLLGIQGNWK